MLNQYRCVFAYTTGFEYVGKYLTEHEYKWLCIKAMSWRNVWMDKINYNDGY